MNREDLEILYVYPRRPDARDPTAGGAENRTSHLLEQTHQSCTVSLLQAEPESPVEDEPPYPNYFFPPLTPIFLTDLNPVYIVLLLKLMLRNNYDIIQVESLGGILTALFFQFIIHKDTTIIYGSHNVEADRAEATTNPDIPRYKQLGAPLVIPLVERVAVRFSDYVIAVSERDKYRFCDEYSISTDSVFVIPSGTDLVNIQRLEPRYSVRSQYGIDEDTVCLVFHGTYGNYPNREAVSLIQSELLPEFRDFEQEILVVIAGAGMPEFDRDGILSIGFVPDLYSFLRAMDIAIVPLMSGSGTKLKVFDYMTIGMPIVATEKAVEGIHVDHETHAMVVEQVDAEFVKSVRSVINDSSRRTTLGTKARELVRTKYDWELIGDQLVAAYQSIAE